LPRTAEEDECLEDFLPATASWNAGGGDIIGVIDGGEKDSGMLCGDVQALVVMESKSWLCSARKSGRCESNPLVKSCGHLPGSLLQ